MLLPTLRDSLEGLSRRQWPKLKNVCDCVSALKSDPNLGKLAAVKLATWNVALPVSEKRRQGLRAWTDQVQADVYVLTETHDGFEPGHANCWSSDAGRDGSHHPAHRWVSIWSNERLEPIPTSDPKRTAAARVHPTDQEPFVVYGTVLPWMGSMWNGHHSKGGVAFRESLAVQLNDWRQLRSIYPRDEFFVLGDFNQDLVGSRPRYYGSVANRRLLEAALAEAGLVAFTSGENDPIRRDSAPCACIDHICGKLDSNRRVTSLTRWPNEPKPPRWLSDHFGVAVELS